MSADLSALVRAEREMAARAVASVGLVDCGVAREADGLRSLFGARHRRLFTEDHLSGFQVTRCDHVPGRRTIPLSSPFIIISLHVKTKNVLKRLIYA